MTKKICVVIALIAIAFWGYAACFNVYEASRWVVRGEDIFSAVLMLWSGVLMFIALLKIFADDVKATTVLFSIAIVLFFIASIVWIYRIIDGRYYQEMTARDVRFFFILNGPVIVSWIVYVLSKNPEKVEVVAQNVEITEEDRKKYVEMVAGSSMYDLRVYAYDKKGVYDPELSSLALEEIREREAGRRKRVTEENVC